MYKHYTKRDVDNLIKESLFAGGSTLSVEEAKRIIRKKATSEGGTFSRFCYPECVHRAAECRLWDWCNLPKKAQDWFDWEGAQDYDYFKFGRHWYCLGDFMQAPESLDDCFDGFASDSYFSGVAIKYNHDTDSVTAALIIR